MFFLYPSNEYRMTALQERLKAIKEQLPPAVNLVAVSKFHPQSALLEAYNVGQRIFGESRVQELVEKYQTLPQDISWHFIGHLQVNKVKYIAPFVELIHAVDSLKLLIEIDKQGCRNNRRIPCLLQVHVAQEEGKFGFYPNELRTFLEEGSWKELPNAHIVGMMCMASYTDDDEQIRSEFQIAQQLFQWAKSTHFADDPEFVNCSWGMSDDYPLAIETGSTMIRVGSSIFGARQ